MKKIISSILAAALTAAALNSAILADTAVYDIGGKDLGKNWSLNVQIPASAFSELTANSYVTVEFEADQSEEEYWSIKPMDSSWTFIDPNGIGGPELAEGKDAYPVQKEDNSITFKVPADFIDSVKSGGMIFIGHSLTLNTLTVSATAPLSDTAAADDVAGAVSDENKSAVENDKTNADTGAEGVAAIAVIAVVAGAAIIICKKKS